MAQNNWPLPPEITKRIVELACWHEPKGQPRQRYSTRLPGIATYAGVCSDWRDLVERLTFRDLRLDRARLADAARIVCPRRQAYVRTVGLDVELEPYGRDLYRTFETAEENARNSALFSETVRLFFDAFSRWAPLDRSNGAGISLRIKAFSPSDIGHYRERDSDVLSSSIQRNRYSQSTSILQLLPAATKLPVVESVSELISGKERHISPSAWTLIVNSLPNAKKIDIDFWENEKRDLELRKRLRHRKSLSQTS